MEMIETKRSSHTGALGYDDLTQSLYVKFKNGGTYIYENVPRQVFEDMLSAPSIGKYFLTKVKPFYRFKKAMILHK